jgi:hypothetical protein
MVKSDVVIPVTTLTIIHHLHRCLSPIESWTSGSRPYDWRITKKSQSWLGTPAVAFGDREIFLRLDVIFGALARYANGAPLKNNLHSFEVLMRMALKAQGQARTTVEAVAEIKNSRPTFARTVNIANGPQQVNQTTGPQ